MPRAFHQATAEQVLAAVDAAVASGAAIDAAFVENFADFPSTQAQSALDLATDLGFLAADPNGGYTVGSPLCVFVVATNEMQRAAALRVVLESYEPFVTFRARLLGRTVADAATQTRALLDLDAHREAIKDTLISLGTYSQALATEGGGQYSPNSVHGPGTFEALAAAAGELAVAESKVRSLLSNESENVSRDNVVLPLANALRRAGTGDPRGAVVEAGNAVESFLIEFGATRSANFVNATGINSKIERLKQVGLPDKIVQSGKYLGHLRNAADHGTDAEIGAPWEIKSNTGLVYLFASTGFILSAMQWHSGVFEL